MKLRNLGPMPFPPSWYDGPPDPPEHCDDEPQTCYYTGRGPCGDCFNPSTKLPMHCFDADPPEEEE